MSEPTKQPAEAQKPKPTTVLFIRHGENDWTETNKLAGRSPAVHLNEYGRQQAEALGQRLADAPIKALYVSPLERTMETAAEIAQHHDGLEITPYPGILEVDYGEWQGAEIKKLSEDEMWPVIQRYPTGARFPGGETMFQMQARMVQAINDLVQTHPGETIAVVGHADLIKSAVAHYLGVHFDLFQRITVSTASVTGVSFETLGPRVLMVNDTSHNPPRPKKDQDDKDKHHG